MGAAADRGDLRPLHPRERTTSAPADEEPEDDGGEFSISLTVELAEVEEDDDYTLEVGDLLEEFDKEIPWAGDWDGDKDWLDGEAVAARSGTNFHFNRSSGNGSWFQINQTSAGGLTATFTDPLGRSTHLEYDLDGRMTRLVDPQQNETTWSLRRRRQPAVARFRRRGRGRGCTQSGRHGRNRPTATGACGSTSTTRRGTCASRIGSIRQVKPVQVSGVPVRLRTSRSDEGGRRRRGGQLHLCDVDGQVASIERVWQASTTATDIEHFGDVPARRAGSADGGGCSPRTAWRSRSTATSTIRAGARVEGDATRRCWRCRRAGQTGRCRLHRPRASSSS